MASDLNSVNLVGRLTRDPDIRANGAVAGIRLAVTSREKQGDDWGDVPNYFDITLFGRQAETAEKYLTKGRRIGITGRLRWREWEDKDGNTRQNVEVIANDLYFLDSSREGGDSSDTRVKPDLEPDTPPARASRDDDDDLPF